MAYLNTNIKTVNSGSAERMQPAGRVTTLTGVYLGFVKNTSDVQTMGRLQVWIPEFGSSPDDQNGWITVNYCSPFAGATNHETIDKNNIKSFSGSQTSYGMWMVPPDINNEVIVQFINGDPSRGIWIGCMYNQFINNMVPGSAASQNNYQYQGKTVPVGDYNKWDTRVTNPSAATKPVNTTKFNGIGNQGLIPDLVRGVLSSNARRESPSQVFGITTPGPKFDTAATPENIRRKGGHSIIMDDATGSELIQMTTKSGAQLLIHESNGFVYLINRDGTSWVQMDQSGNIDIFGAANISMRSQADINLRADRNINIEAGQNVYIKAAQDTRASSSTFTYDVNNKPVTKNITLYGNVGEGKGDGGNVVIQSVNNTHITAKKSALITVVENDLNLLVNNKFSVTTVKGSQNYESKQAINMTTDGSFNIASTGSSRISSGGLVSIIGSSGISLCTPGKLSSNADGGTVLNGAQTIVGSYLGATGDIVAAGNVVKFGAVSNPGTTPPEVAQVATSAKQAEVKPLINKINILPTWKDAGKFKRNAQAVMTTVSRLPTYESCPEHEQFTYAFITGYVPPVTGGDKTYEGSAGSGNTNQQSPANNPDPGAQNKDITGEQGSGAEIKDFNLNAFMCQLKIHEGVKYTSYNDSRNKPTGGIGHLLRPNEIQQYPVPSQIPESQVTSWFNDDAAISIRGAQRVIGTDAWGDLSDIRKRACADLCYNLGEGGFSKFQNFISAMKAGNFQKAGDELRNSAWYGQVGRRGPNIVSMVVNNIDPNVCDKKFPGV